MARLNPRQPRFGPASALALGALVAAGLFAVLFPWFPAGDALREGAEAPWTITAPRGFSFESELQTREMRAQAAAAVEDVLVLDPSIRDRQIAELDRQILAIERIRDDATQATSARESAIRAIPGVSLSPKSAQVIVAASRPDWGTMALEARSALARTMNSPVREAELAVVRQRTQSLLSASISADQQAAVGELITPLIVPTLVVDAQRTANARSEARSSQAAVRVSRERGEVLVQEGERLTPADIELLEHAGLYSGGVRTLDVAAAALLALLGGVAAGAYLLAAQPRSLGTPRRMALFALLLILPSLAARVALPLALPDHDRHFLAYALPLAAAPMTAAVLLDVTVAVFLTMLLAGVAAFVVVTVPLAQAAPTQLEAVRMLLAVTGSSLAGVYVSARADRLHRYIAAGVASGVLAGAALFVVWLIDVDRRPVDLVWAGGAVAVGGLLAALIAVGSFVLLSRPFGIITRVELMELTQLSHPLLRRLQDEAPGTFQHSILVGNLAERAADRIGADPLLVRIGSYYHDIGKLVAPPFFIENSSEENPHRSLDPLQSTRVILQHVTAGTEIARREGLPEAVVQFIPQHHGTRLVSYFYRRAAALDPDIDPELFRYPGPRPRSRETALVMLADASEATVRASNDRSAERIREIVDGIVRERVEEGQFDDCDISLQDLRAVVDAYSATLTAVYHPRVEYPAPTDRELASRRTAPLPGQDIDEAPWPRLRRPPNALPAAAGAPPLASASDVAPAAPPAELSEDTS